jgi:hypothetical protein
VIKVIDIESRPRIPVPEGFVGKILGPSEERTCGDRGYQSPDGGFIRCKVSFEGCALAQPILGRGMSAATRQGTRRERS